MMAIEGESILLKTGILPRQKLIATIINGAEVFQLHFRTNVPLLEWLQELLCKMTDIVMHSRKGSKS